MNLSEVRNNIKLSKDPQAVPVATLLILVDGGFRAYDAAGGAGACDADTGV